MIGEDIQRGNGPLDGYKVGDKYELISCDHTHRRANIVLRRLRRLLMV